MLRPRVIPCLLYDGAGLVKTVKFKNRKYVGDPINAINIFNDKEVDELIFLDIEASRRRREPDYAMVELISSRCFMPLCYGGGVRTVEQIKRLLSLGVEKVAINTAAVEEPNLVAEAASYFGNQAIVGSIDVKRGLFGGVSAVIRGGETSSGLTPQALAQRMASLGVGEILLNSVDRDGMMQGYDIALLSQIVASVEVPIIACGGAGSVSDLAAAMRAGASAAAAGSLFVFYGPHRAVLINYPSPDAVARALNA